MNSFFALIQDGTPVTKTIALSTTIDFASTAAAGTSTSDITVPGAQPGDLVLLGVPATANNGLIYDARVSAANTVQVRALNITAVAIDPASGTFKIVVFKL